VKCHGGVGGKVPLQNKNAEEKLKVAREKKNIMGKNIGRDSFQGNRNSSEESTEDS